MVIRITYVTPKRGIIRLDIECTRIRERISRNTTNILKFKSTPSNPLKQIPCFINVFTKKTQVL